MATINTITPQSFLPLAKPNYKLSHRSKSLINKSQSPTITTNNKKRTSILVVRSLTNELDVIPVQSQDYTDQQDGGVLNAGGLERETEGDDVLSQVAVVAGFANDTQGRLMSFEAAGFSSATSSGTAVEEEEEDLHKLIDRAINAAIVLAAGSFAITKLLTIDRDYWHVSPFILSNLIILLVIFCADDNLVCPTRVSNFNLLWMLVRLYYILNT